MQVYLQLPRRNSIYGAAKLQRSREQNKFIYVYPLAFPYIFYWRKMGKFHFSPIEYADYGYFSLLLLHDHTKRQILK